MASEQLRRDNKTNEREIHVTKDKVPKLTSHFESLRVKDSGDQPPVIHQNVIKMHGASGEIQEQGKKDRTEMSMQLKKDESDQHKRPSDLEEISKYRAASQQNSMDAILAAEEKYQKSKEKGEPTNNVNNVDQKGTLTQAAMEKAKESLSGVTQVALENAARASDFTVVKGQQAKAGLSSAAEKAARAKDYTLEKSGNVKDVIAERTTGMVDTTVDVSKKSASYVGEKAVAVKEAALGTGKTTAGYVGKVAGVVKDKALIAGWSAAEFAGEKAVVVTENMANVTAGVAGYAGNTAVAAKDVLVDVSKKTKDMVVSTEENAKDYAARKKAEKQRELEGKNSSKGEGEIQGKSRTVYWGHEGRGYEHQLGDYEHDQGGGGTMVEEGKFEHQGGFETNIDGVGLMRVIKETFVEIGKNTKDMLVGKDETAHDRW